MKPLQRCSASVGRGREAVHCTVTFRVCDFLCVGCVCFSVHTATGHQSAHQTGVVQGKTQPLNKLLGIGRKAWG